MKASFESISAGGQASFSIRLFKENAFSAPYHFHPEYELTLIVEGTGQRYVGAHMHEYNKGDLVLLGSNLPHCWKTAATQKGNSVSVVVQFQKDFLGPIFFTLPEMQQVQQLLIRSRHGLHFVSDTTAIQKKMLRLVQGTDGGTKLLDTLAILHELATRHRYQVLEQQIGYPSLPATEKKRIHAVMAYIVDHFQTHISLGTAAALANLTPEAFCKYFKKINRKTFIEVVNDYRIDFALSLLINTEKTVTEIGFDSGFNDASNFYKTFKQRTGISPLQYRKTFIQVDKKNTFPV